MSTINSIKHLRDFRIFKEFEGKTIEPFKKRNLIYGWNGSGKTTLSNFFSILELKKVDDELINSKWCISTDIKEFNNYEIQGINLNIKVFNESFVNRNIDFNGLVKGLLIVDEKKISEKEEYNNKQKELKALKEVKLPKSNDEKNNLSKEISLFSANSAKEIKQKFKLIDTDDNRFLNYDKRKLETFIQENFEKIKNRIGILQKEELDKTAKGVRPQQRESIEQLEEINIKDNENVYNRVVELLLSTVVTKTIDKLKSNPELSSWVEKGLLIHGQESSICEFCGNALSEQRIKELNDHFNKSFQELSSNISNGIKWIESQEISIQFPDKAKFYDEFQDEYESYSKECNKYIEHFNIIIKEWLNELDSKSQNIFYIPEGTISGFSNKFINEFRDSYEKVKEIINNHNNKYKEYENVLKTNKHKLELHYVIEAVEKFKYFQKKTNLTKLEKEVEKLGNDIKIIEDRINELQKTLSNEILGSVKFNESLHRFLGRNDISLKFIPEKQAYSIERNGFVAKNLSEGEKRAIAFIYYVTKLQENGNRIEDTILVIDDPVSSFDSNHLFNAFSFLKCKCENAKQLFVLTHNFTFFKLIRQWFAPNKHDKTFNPNIKESTDKVRIYTIDCFFVGKERKSVILNADDTLKEYDSEYHYLFKKLTSLKGKVLSIDEAYLSANLARKLLETFLNFKYPKSRNDFRVLLQFALKTNESESNKIKEERIYRFINKYSHASSSDNEDLEIRLSEQKDIVELIFQEIQTIDSAHYNEMIEIINN